jgi:hypothetical protein
MLPARVWAAPAAAFAAFGGLVGWRVVHNAIGGGIGAIFGAVFALLAVHLLVMILRLTNSKADRDGISQAAGTGLLLLLPFAALALVAELLLGWNASQAFASAALVTACGGVGAEVVRRGGGGLRSVLVPAVLAFLLSAAWILLSVLAGRFWS